MDAVFIGSIIILCMLSAYFRVLTINGSIAAFFTGILIYLSFEWKGLVILGLFFVTSSLLTKWKKDKKTDVNACDSEGKLGRTSGQVLANGGAAVCAAIGHLTSEHSVWLILFVCVFATATADTWASEIGTLSKSKPFHLKERKRVEKGLSGAVSILGTLAAVFGAALIALCFYFLYKPESLLIVVIITFAGFMGNIADTIIGAWFEQKFLCTVCKSETEATVHCQTKTVKVFGYSWFTNNKVNFLSTIFGGCIGGGIYTWLFQ